MARVPLTKEEVAPTRLVLNVEKQLGALKVAAKFETAVGVTALFGPSGSGKTSIVNMIAGLLTPDRGRIAINGTLLAGGASPTDLRPGGSSFDVSYSLVSLQLPGVARPAWVRAGRLAHPAGSAGH